MLQVGLLRGTCRSGPDRCLGVRRAVGSAGIGALGVLSDLGTWDQRWRAWSPLCLCFGGAPKGSGMDTFDARGEGGARVTDQGRVRLAKMSP